MDLSVSKSLEDNLSLKMMEKINKVVKWRNIEALLMEHYEVGTRHTTIGKKALGWKEPTNEYYYIKFEKFSYRGNIPYTLVVKNEEEVSNRCSHS